MCLTNNAVIGISLNCSSFNFKVEAMVIDELPGFLKLLHWDKHTLSPQSVPVVATRNTASNFHTHSGIRQPYGILVMATIFNLTEQSDVNTTHKRP